MLENDGSGEFTSLSARLFGALPFRRKHSRVGGRIVPMDDESEGLESHSVFR